LAPKASHDDHVCSNMSLK